MKYSIFLRRIALAALVTLGILPAAHAQTLLPQEQAIANYMITDPGQGRPKLILDPIIESVARARAKDMAVRNYFDHVNPDGVAANYLLRQAGYQLPSWWGTDPTANYVESIAAGYASASDTWTQWMNSPPHKEHLLGQNSFFATETHYGVGYYYDPNSQYQYYWVVITAPPPPLEISAPAPATDVTGPSVAIAGSADTSTNPATVQFCVVNTDGTSAWQPATGVAAWTGTASGLEPGANVIHVQSLDGSGNVIAEATRTVTYTVQGILAVSVSGSGVVTAALSGTTSQPVGEPVTIKATPAAGCIFTGWTGSVTSGNATLTFPMQNAVSLQANFQPSPFLTTAGAYYGIVTAGSGAPDGFLRLTVSSLGVFTGRVFVSGSAWSFTGRLDVNGDATVTIPIRGQQPLVISLQADLTDGAGQITGTVVDGAGSFGFAISQDTFNAKTDAAPQTGRYTLALSPDPATTGSSAPQGNGYAAIVVQPNGTATVNGRLADGTPYSATAHVANDGTLAVYCVPSGSPRGSSVNGLLTFAATDTSDVSGMLAWTKGVNAADPYYPAGFSAQLPCVGSHYAKPVPGIQSMDASPGPATAGLGDGNLPQPLSVPVTITTKNTATMVIPGAPNLAFTINPVSGVVSGSFLLPDGNVTRAIRGIVLQKQQSAFGYFRGVDQCGSFSVSQVQ